MKRNKKRRETGPGCSHRIKGGGPLKQHLRLTLFQITIPFYRAHGLVCVDRPVALVARPAMIINRGQKKVQSQYVCPLSVQFEQCPGEEEERNVTLLQENWRRRRRPPRHHHQTYKDSKDCHYRVYSRRLGRPAHLERMIRRRVALLVVKKRKKEILFLSFSYIFKVVVDLIWLSNWAKRDKSFIFKQHPITPSGDIFLPRRAHNWRVI